MSRPSSDAHSRVIDEEDEMFLNHYDAARAEVEYRQTHIAEMYRRANRRRVREPKKALKHNTSQGLAKVRPAA